MDYTFDIDKALDDFEKGEDSSSEVISQEKYNEDFKEKYKNRHGLNESSALPSYKISSEIPKNQFHSEYKVFHDVGCNRWTKQFSENEEAKTNPNFTSDFENISHHLLNQSTSSTHNNECLRISQKSKGDVPRESFLGKQSPSQRDSFLLDLHCADYTKIISTTGDECETNGYHINEEEELLSVSFDDSNLKDSTLNRHSEVNIQIQVLPSVSAPVNSENCTSSLCKNVNSSPEVELKSKSVQSVSDSVFNMVSNTSNDLESVNKMQNEKSLCVQKDLILSDYPEQELKEKEKLQEMHCLDSSQHSNKSPKSNLKDDFSGDKLVVIHSNDNLERTLEAQVESCFDTIKGLSEDSGHFRTKDSLIHKNSAHLVSDEKSNDDLGVSCSPGQYETQTFAGFTDVDNGIDESDLREMEEYLSDVNIKDVQDKDSGVSFPEGDLNCISSISTGVIFSSNLCDENMKQNVNIEDSILRKDLRNNSVELSYEEAVPESKEIFDSSNSYQTSLQNKVTENNLNGMNNDSEKNFSVSSDKGNLENIKHSFINNFLETTKEISTGARPKMKDHSASVSTGVANQMKHFSDQNSVDIMSKKHASVSSCLPSTSKLLHDGAGKQNQNGNKENCEVVCKEDSCSDKSFSSEIENSENLEVENEKQVTVDLVDHLPLNASQAKNTRIPRPTTLDLPARVTVKPKTSPTDLGIEDSSTPESDDHKNGVPDSEDGSLPTESLPNANTGVALSESDHELGKKKPFWIPDADAPTCMHCGAKFTVIKRRHHCRACGKVLCSQCCSQKAKLAFDNKEVRVCQQCLVILSRVQEIEKQCSTPPSSTALSPDQGAANSNTVGQSNGTNLWRPNPNNPEDYVSTISPLQQAQINLNCPPPTVMVPGVGVLRKGGKPRGEPKTVIFADGIRPGGDLTDPEPSDLPLKPVRGFRVNKRTVGDIGYSQLPSGIGNSSDSQKHKVLHSRQSHKRLVINDSEGPLHPILLPLDYDLEEKPDAKMLIKWLEGDSTRSVTFAVTKNLHILTKILKLDCCIGSECWCFSSRGLHTVGQDEVMVILQRISDEITFPRDVFHLFSTLYDSASNGSPVGELGHTLFPDGILGSREHSGFLFVRPTFQCLRNLTLPHRPYLVALLIQKWEVPWAKVFPLRLMLRLGAEFRYYPCPLVSVRFRRPVFGEVGHTIMKIFADFRNYQFTLQFIPGIVIHMEERMTCVNFPRNRYEKVMSILSNDHVLALGSNFSSEADSHLVCMQNDNGDYQTQAINIQNTPRNVTGASFIAFCGALKTTTGLTAKSSIVEDGLLVQIPADTMVAMKNALRDMTNFSIDCGRIGFPPEEVVMLQWTEDDRKFNIGVKSPIDGRSLDGVQSVRIYTGTDYAGEHYLIRWTEVFFIQIGDSGSGKCSEPADPSRLAKAMAAACCPALTPYLDQLVESEFTKIGLRATLDSERDREEYEIGSRESLLPSVYMNALDSALIPVISCVSASNQEGPVVLELIFHIILK